MPVTAHIAASADFGSDGYGGWRSSPTAADAAANGEKGTRLHVPSASIAA